MTAPDPALEVLAGALDDARSATVEMVIADKFVTCHVADDLQKALGAMSEHQLHRIPVVGQDNKIAGIIAQVDVATHADQPEQTAAAVKEAS